MKKIFIDKNESVAEVVERIVAAEEPEIVLVIPQKSLLRESAANFRLLKREAEACGKTVAVESVDEDILGFAKENGLTVSHPLFKEKSAPSMSDIVPTGEEKKERGRGRKSSRHASFSGDGEIGKENLQAEHIGEKGVKREIEEIGVEPEQEKAFKQSHPRGKIAFSFSRRKFKVLAGLVISILILAAGVILVNKFFGRAQVLISLQKTPWQYQGNFSASKKISGIDAERISLPLEVFEQQKNITQLFPASGRAKVSQKAAGIITIFNAYSSRPQILVAATRFQTADGKIFRLNPQVIVPGAEIQGGKLAPASIDAQLTADQAGPDYNVGPTDRLTIPGFKGTPRYAGFYGSLKQGTSGGYIGEKAVPTDQDISLAQTKATTILKTSLQSSLLNNQPADFLILDGASELKITKLTVNKNTDNKGNFSVFGEAGFTALAFRESDIHSLLQTLAQKDHPGLVLSDWKIDYQNPKPDFNSGQLNFSLSAETVLKPQLSDSDIKNKILGKNIEDARSLILALPDLSQAKISLWPFWLKNFPTDPAKISITID